MKRRGVMAKLKNEKHERFCNEYIKDLNATQSYMRTYKVKKEETAKAAAARLLTNVNVQARIREIMARREKRTEITTDMVVKRLADLAFGHLGMICTWDDNGLILLDSKDLSDAELAIVSNIKMTPVSVEIIDKDGKKTFERGFRREVSQKDSLKALELLCKHLGILDGPGSGKTKDRGGATERVGGALGRIKERLGRRKGKS